MATWNLDRCIVTAGGQRLQGFGETDAITLRPATERFEVVDCCDGGTVHNRILSTRGEAEITLRYNSAANRVLALLDSVGEAFSFNVLLPNGDVYESGEARVTKTPEVSLGGKVGEYVWGLSLVPLRVTYSGGGA